jgi:hypothetical protein
MAPWGIPLLLAVTGGCSAAPTGSEPTASGSLDERVEPGRAVEPSGAHAARADRATLRFGGWGHVHCPECTDDGTDGGVGVDAGTDDGTDGAAAPACSSDEVTCGSGCCGPTNQMQCVNDACQPICDHAQPLCGGVCCPQGQLCNSAGVCGGE